MDPEALQDLYEKRSSDYDRLRQDVERLLRQHLSDVGLRYVAITSRLKTFDSFESKAIRKGYLEEPFEHINDLAGVRVVCNYDTEVRAAENEIRQLFNVHDVDDKSRSLGVDKMGYDGVHMIVSLGDKYPSPVFRKIGKARCEIQVRTVLQDAWAIINHNLVYKSEEAVPDRLKRDLNNVAALLEVAQGVFETVREKQALYRAEIEERANAADLLSRPVDYETLIAYSGWRFPKREISEVTLSRLALDLHRGGYSALRQIEEAVNRAEVAVAAFKTKLPGHMHSSTDEIVKSLAFVDFEFRKQHGFPRIALETFLQLQSLVRDESRA